MKKSILVSLILMSLIIVGVGLVVGLDPAPNDQDGDGVLDYDFLPDGTMIFPDQCLFTTPGATVDEFGCEIGGSTDADDDGVDNSVDLCPLTLPGETVDSEGCALSQICTVSDSYKNHGDYVSCVSHEAGAWVVEGLITSEEKDLIVSEAAQSCIGKPSCYLY